MTVLLLNAVIKIIHRKLAEPTGLLPRSTITLFYFLSFCLTPSQPTASTHTFSGLKSAHKGRISNFTFYCPALRRSCMRGSEGVNVLRCDPCFTAFVTLITPYSSDSTHHGASPPRLSERCGPSVAWQTAILACYTQTPSTPPTPLTGAFRRVRVLITFRNKIQTQKGSNERIFISSHSV